MREYRCQDIHALRYCLHAARQGDHQRSADQHRIRTAQPRHFRMLAAFAAKEFADAIDVTVGDHGECFRRAIARPQSGAASAMDKLRATGRQLNEAFCQRFRIVRTQFGVIHFCTEFAQAFHQ